MLLLLVMAPWLTVLSSALVPLLSPLVAIKQRCDRMGHRWHRMVLGTFSILGLIAPTAAVAADRCSLTPVLIEDFNDESISSRQIGPARWIAHTPWNGDFGDARFADPGPDGPFAVKNDVLSITASRDAEGRWKSGLIAAADASGAGPGTRYGYFEARMKLPPGPGTWPAFWLAGKKSAPYSDGNVEVDVMEYYGQFTSAYRTAIHVWYKNPEKTRGEGEKIDVPDLSLVQTYHTYGVDISPKEIVFFLDRRPVARQPTPLELTTPMYPLVDLALGSGWPIDRTPDPSTLLVGYVHVYGRDGDLPKGCTAGPPS